MPPANYCLFSHEMLYSARFTVKPILMEEVMVKRKYVPASISETAFNCPYCGALCLQAWHKIFIREITENDRKPRIFWDEEEINKNSRNGLISVEDAKLLTEYARMLNAGVITFEEEDIGSSRVLVHNVHLSRCYNCHKVAVWVHDRLLFPPELYGEEPNPDIPDDILRDYEEARSILNLSPRGAAALLRLAVQKLCKHLGEKGDDINKDIGSLVQKGLSIKVQRALDIVRVIGNQAVHPGVIDLRDDRDTALNLFSLINLIVEQMISQHNHIDNMYNGLPSDKIAAIERRDAQK